jgi:hypothetical protein
MNKYQAAIEVLKEQRDRELKCLDIYPFRHCVPREQHQKVVEARHRHLAEIESGIELLEKEGK